MMLFYILLSLVVLQRISELFLSRRNERWLRSHGAFEVGRDHYPWIVSLHVAFFLSLIVEVHGRHTTTARWWWLPFVLFLLAQLLRYWSIATLGHRWTTRILILPKVEPIHTGPYRFFPHPNYLAVAIELIAFPLIFQAYFTAAVFTLLNALLMSIRIPTERRALQQKTL